MNCKFTATLPKGRNSDVRKYADKQLNYSALRLNFLVSQVKALVKSS